MPARAGHPRALEPHRRRHCREDSRRARHPQAAGFADPVARGAARGEQGLTQGVPLVRLDRVTKRFGEVSAVHEVSLDIEAGEIFALLGPSGCGKTTLMRLIAGFEQPDEGRVFIGGVDMTDVPPHKRPVNMMFQSYALFPHMSVEKNIGFGLQQEGAPRAEITERVAEMLRLVQLEGLGKRRPAQLSGGQKQRVALARALAKRPKLLLLDEPLAALDRKLREQTQFELKEVQRKLGTAFVVVTHDQEEASVMASRIAVMRAGKLEQIGPPAEIYARPASRFVAEFIGDINILEGDAATAVRPERIRLERGADSPGNALDGIVDDLAFRGSDILYRVRLATGTTLRVVTPNSGDRNTYRRGDKVRVEIPPDAHIPLEH
ncbi:MAG: ABC transporter ATP-binding protein [Methylobacteriaceae bacterium]|nr:ABC transporter ATP-binding protein [Methylobacteriaceae bacterium]